MFSHEIKLRSWWYPAETIKDTDYADDLALLANIPAQVESLLHSLEQVARSIGLYMNANKTEDMHFKQEEAPEIIRSVHIPRQQYLIYWEWWRHTHRKDINSYLQVIDHTEIWSHWLNETRFILSSGLIGTTVELNNLESDEKHWKKKLYAAKNKPCKQQPLKTVTIQPFNFHLRNH